MRASFWNFSVCIELLTLVLVLWILKIKYGLLSNQLSQRKQEHGGWKEPQGKDKRL